MGFTDWHPLDNLAAQTNRRGHVRSIVGSQSHPFSFWTISALDPHRIFPIRGAGSRCYSLTRGTPAVAYCSFVSTSQGGTFTSWEMVYSVLVSFSSFWTTFGSSIYGIFPTRGARFLLQEHLGYRSLFPSRRREEKKFGFYRSLSCFTLFTKRRDIHAVDILLASLFWTTTVASIYPIRGLSFLVVLFPLGKHLGISLLFLFLLGQKGFGYRSVFPLYALGKRFGLTLASFVSLSFLEKETFPLWDFCFGCLLVFSSSLIRFFFTWWKRWFNWDIPTDLEGGLVLDPEIGLLSNTLSFLYFLFCCF